MQALFTLCTAVVFSCIFEISQAQCNGTSCNGSVQVTTTTTSISVPNCNLSIEGSTNQSSVLTDLTPGEVFTVQAHCFNCCLNATTKPESVLNLTVTDVTTSSLSLNWTKPQGRSSIYSVQWTDGGDSKEETETVKQKEVV
uniref:Fibronectin type-III domain-containing protein n=1 Tax=Knipowitschia caucasica TaxID=637954 RepID=A0AAV2KZP4_KNICA